MNPGCAGRFGYGWQSARNASRIRHPGGADLCAPSRTLREESGPHPNQFHQNGCAAPTHGDMGKDGGQAQTGRKFALPGSRVGTLQLGLDRSARHHRGAVTPEQVRTQKRRRLQGHAHAFTQNRMGFSCGIADPENPVPGIHAHAGIQRSSRQPGPVTPGAMQSLLHAKTRTAQPGFDGITRAK